MQKVKVDFFRKILLIIGLGTWLLSWEASAEVLSYSNQASFDAASTTLIVNNFEGLTSNLLFGDPIVVDGVSYESSQRAIVCAATWCGGQPFDSAIMASDFGTPLEIDVSGLGFDVTAIGGIFGDADSGPTEGTVDIYGIGDALLASFAIDALDIGAGLEHSFFGFTTTDGEIITRLVYSLSGNYPAVDNMQFGVAVSPVPLPAALPLFLTILAGMGFLRWRRNKRAADDERPFLAAAF